MWQHLLLRRIGEPKEVARVYLPLFPPLSFRSPTSCPPVSVTPLHLLPAFLPLPITPLFYLSPPSRHIPSTVFRHA